MTPAQTLKLARAVESHGADDASRLRWDEIRGEYVLEVKRTCQSDDDGHSTRRKHWCEDGRYANSQRVAAALGVAL